MKVKCEDLKRAGGDTSDEALQVALLADLQAHQDRDAERLMERLIDQVCEGTWTSIISSGWFGA